MVLLFLLTLSSVSNQDDQGQVLLTETMMDHWSNFTGKLMRLFCPREKTRDENCYEGEFEVRKHARFIDSVNHHDELSWKRD